MKKVTLITVVILLLLVSHLPAFGSPQAALTAWPEAFNSLIGSTSFSYTLSEVSNSSVFIKIYNEQGTVVRTFDEGLRSSGTYNITWDGKDDSNNMVPEGTYQASLNTSTDSGDTYHSVSLLGGLGTGVGHLSAQKGLALDPDGNILVADTNNNRIQKFNSSTWSVLDNFDVINEFTNFSLPFAVAVGQDSSIYATDTYHNRVMKLSPAGWNVFATGTNFNNFNKSLVQPKGVAVDPEGNVYVLDPVNNRVVKFSSSGEPLLEWGGVYQNFMRPDGIAAGSSGIYVIHYAYINNETVKRIQRFSNRGELLTWNPATTLTDPSAVAVDGSGNVFVAYTAGSADHRIVKLNSNGEFITEWGSNGTGAGQLGEAYGIAVDPAGNVYVSESSNSRIQVFGPPSGGQLVSAETTLLVDNTPSVLIPVTEPIANENGWYNRDVAVTFKATDALSGVLEDSVTAPVTVTTEGAGQTINGSATDKAGNTTTTSITLNIDKTPPVIQGTPTTLPNENGWYNHDVIVAFTSSDSLSGIDPATTESVTITTEGSDQSATGTAMDKAGNTSTAVVSGFNIDKTPPAIVIQIPADDCEYLLHQADIAASWDASDSLSGIVTTSGTPAGSPIDTSQVGTRSFTATAVDKAGNSSTKTAVYDVHYVYSGVLRPVKSDGTSIFKLGSTIPVKFQLTDVNGNAIGDATATLELMKTEDAEPEGEIEMISAGEASTGTHFRYDSVEAQYIFNLRTDNLSKGAWELRIALDDGTTNYQKITLR